MSEIRWAFRRVAPKVTGDSGRRHERGRSAIEGGRMHEQYFISYSREDADFVGELDRDLRNAGISTWRDEKRLDPGDLWDKALADGIAESAAFILVISPASVRSPWVKQEVSYANRQRKPFFPIVHRATKIPRDIDFAVGRFQTLDFAAGQYTDVVQELVNAIRGIDVDEPVQGTGLGKRASPAAVYVEDVVAFYKQVPRGILWRALALGGASTWQRLLWIVALRPWSSVGYFLTIATPLLIGVAWYAIANGIASQISPGGALKILLAIGALAAAPTLLSALVKVPLRLIVDSALTEMYFWCAHRPLRETHNALLDHWDKVQPVVKELLKQPSNTWDDYVTARCPDPELAGRVYAALFVLMGVEFHSG